MICSSIQRVEEASAGGFSTRSSIMPRRFDARLRIDDSDRAIVKLPGVALLLARLQGGRRCHPGARLRGPLTCASACAACKIGSPFKRVRCGIASNLLLFSTSTGLNVPHLMRCIKYDKRGLCEAEVSRAARDITQCLWPSASPRLHERLMKARRRKYAWRFRSPMRSDPLQSAEGDASLVMEPLGRKAGISGRPSGPAVVPRELARNDG